MQNANPITPEVQQAINATVNALFFKIGIYWFLLLCAIIVLLVFLGHKYVNVLVEKSLEKYRSEIRSLEMIEQARWEIKRDACLNALNIANAILSNYKYENVDEEGIVKQSVTTRAVRECFNTLACTCDTSVVIDELKNILYSRVRPDAIVDIRTAVRKELGFGNEIIDTDREKAFVRKVIGDPAVGKAKK